MAQNSRIPAILFGATLAMALVVVAAWLVEDGDPTRPGRAVTEASWALPHARYATMEQGGPGPDRNGPTFWLGWVFALLQIVFFTFCLLLGMMKRGGWGPTAGPLLLGGLGWVLVCCGLFWSYHSYMTEGSGSSVLGLPAATAWMLYGVWPYPVLFVLYFIYIFHDWFLRKQDLEQFRQLLLARETDGAEDQE